MGLLLTRTIGRDEPAAHDAQASLAMALDGLDRLDGRVWLEHLRGESPLGLAPGFDEQARWLLGQLWGCRDELPPADVEHFGLPERATYADVARLLVATLPLDMVAAAG